MGMHPEFNREDSFVLVDMLFSHDKLKTLSQLIEKKLVSNESIPAWIRFLSELEKGSSRWFKTIDYLKVNVDPAIHEGGNISERSPLDIVTSYRGVSALFDRAFFTPDNFRNKTAIDYGCGVFRPLGVAVILFVNGLDRVFAYEPFPLREGFAYASLMQVMNEMLVHPGRFDFSGIGESEIIRRLHSLNLKDIDVHLRKIASGEIRKFDLGGVIFTNSIDEVPSGEIDFHFSNAVFEHIPDMGELSRILQRIASPDSIGYHIVDFVDHRYYDDSSLSPFEKYYDGYLHEINGLLPSELEAPFINTGWNLNKATLQIVPESFFARETRKIIARYENTPMSELSQHINGYEFRKADAS